MPEMTRALRWALCGLLLSTACGGSKKNVPVAPGDTPYEGHDSGTSTTPAQPTPDKDAGVDPLAPSVEITSPTAASDPNDDSVLTDPSVTVRCRATRSTLSGSSKVDQSKVVISLDDPKGSNKPIVSPITAVSEEEFTAQFALAALPNGPLRFRCTASDLASAPHVGSTSLITYLDLGPVITIASPKEKGVYSLNTPVAIEFKVDTSPLSDADKEADVDEIKLRVSGVDTSFEPSTTKPGFYETNINFKDKGKFPVPPVSAQIVVTASDKRTPTAGTRSITLDIVIDGEGPTIKIEAPKDLSIVHGNNNLQVNVTDPSGIKPESLTATVGGTLTINSWKAAPPVFTQSFDTRAFPTTLTQLQINVTASDTVGNETTARLLLFLDNLPPLIGLDPPAVRELRRSGTSTFCSQPFLPTGDAAARDLDARIDFADKSVYFRALIEDLTNHSPGSNFDYYAGINDSRVEIYLEADPTEPLLIHADKKDGKNGCDEVNLAVLDKPNKTLHKETLQPVGQRGSAFWSDPSMGTVSVACPYDPTGTDPQKYACDHGTEMFRVIRGERRADKPPAVYALHPADTGECTGVAWNVEQFLRDRPRGWYCVAVRAEDTFSTGSGNIGVSPPLRLCYGTLSGSAPSITCEGAPPPTCTDGCEISNSQRWPEGMTWDDLD